MYRFHNNKEDVEYVLDHLRPEDLQEVQAMHGENWREEVLKSTLEGKDVIVGKKKGTDVPVLIGGICPSEEEGIGVAWLLCTEEIENNGICLLREIKMVIEEADEKYWLTYNYIYKDNMSAKIWLRKMGYRFDTPRPEGVEIPEDFEFFYRIRPIKGLGV